MNKNDVEQMLKPKELMEILGLGKSAIHRLLITGELPSVIVTSGARKKSRRVLPSVLQKWLKGREIKND